MEIQTQLQQPMNLTGATETRTPGCITRVERKKKIMIMLSEEDTPNEPHYNTSSYQLNTYKMKLEGKF